jgi:hypothetical protein
MFSSRCRWASQIKTPINFTNQFTVDVFVTDLSFFSVVDTSATQSTRTCCNHRWWTVPTAAESKVSIVFAIIRFSFDSLPYRYRYRIMDTDEQIDTRLKPQETWTKPLNANYMTVPKGRTIDGQIFRKLSEIISVTVIRPYAVGSFLFSAAPKRFCGTQNLLKWPQSARYTEDCRTNLTTKYHFVQQSTLLTATNT